MKYHGPYFYGMNSRNDKPHKHRFYQENGKEVSGIISAINFIDKEKLKKEVCIGGADPNDKPTEWYQNLSDIKRGSFAYFEVFNGKITNIGKNFLFKALFLHEDAIPEANKECKDVSLLCPRCSLFGMTDKTENESKAANGFKGRFKASALISRIGFADEEKYEKKYPFLNQKVFLKKWLNENNEPIAYQTLLPISLSPRPNKRDVNGYFNKGTGEINGAKYYLHSRINSAENINNVDNKQENYEHSIRNYAQVCEKGLEFTGTVGAENCTTDEIAALLMLLHSPIANHGFKIGLGKAFGMGSIESKISKVWIRGKDYSWKSFNSPEEFLNEHGEIKSNTDRFKNVLQTIGNLLLKEGDKMSVPNIKLEYPKPGLSYWKEFFPQKNNTQKR